MYEEKTYKVPICSICSVAASVWACDIDPKSQTPNTPHLIPTNDWLRLKGNIFICSSCADVLRDIFIEEQKPKDSFYIPKTLEEIAKQKPEFEKKEEHWITRNGTRVVVKMPLPTVGSIYNGSPVGMGEKPTLLRWDKNYNCVEVSWLPRKEGHHYELASYDLVERLEDSVKKEQG